MDFKEKDVVWIKLCGYPWWPAQVTDDYIQFFNEDCIEPIKSSSNIKAFNCKKKESFIRKGLSQINKERKALFFQALNMASNISDGNSKYLDKFSCHCEDSSLTENRDIRHVSENNRLDSCNGGADQQDVFCKNQLGIENNDVNDKKLGNKNKNNVTRSECKLKVNTSQKQQEISDTSNAMDTKSCTKNVQNMCSYNTCSPARTNYLEFKSNNLQRKIDWNTYDPGEENKHSEKKTSDIKLASCPDLIQSVDSNILVDGAKTTNKACNVKVNKRKLTYDDNCNDNMKHSRKETVLNKSESSITPTRKLYKNNSKSLSNANLMIKTFILSQKSKENVNVKGKRGRPKKCKSMTEPSDNITSTSRPTEDIKDHQRRNAPKCFKWKNESFELPTPTLSHNDSCSSFLTNTSFDVNLDNDTCDSSSDSDTDLPEGLSPIVTEHPICEKDIVWLKWKKYPTWPAYVRKVYKKKRRIHKLSLTYIEGYADQCKRLNVAYRSKFVIPFVDKQKDQFISEGKNITDPVLRQTFIEACEKAENFLHKKALMSLNKDEFSFYGDSDGEEIESDVEEINPQDIIVTSSVPEYHSEEMSDKEKERLRKMTAKQENLVNFIKSEEMKKYLLDIFYERRKCELHRKFFHGTIKEKNSLRFAGFGPIYNEEQEEEIVNMTKTWWDQLPKEHIPDISYILDVWIPEAVVYGLIKIKGYGRKKAWEQFEKGVYMTKSEKKKQHDSMMEFAGYTEEEKQEILEKARERMDTFKYQHGLT